VVGWVGRKDRCSAERLLQRWNPTDLLAELRNIVPDEDRVSVDAEELEHCGQVFSYHASRSPNAAFFPQNRDEVVEILRFANGSCIPVVPYGERSSLEGNTIPLRCGISLNLSLMNEILEVRPGAFVTRVEPGVTHGELNEAHQHAIRFLRELGPALE
jgi:D-lactate dehydrogenase (cytochrome)